MSAVTARPLRVGVDVARVSEVAASIDRFGGRYLHRLFTEHELRACADPEGSPSPAGLAARFAAKEATFKVLRPTGGARPDWRSVEVRRHPEGWCDLVLTGAAAGLAESGHLGRLAVSLSHDGDMAAAVVIAEPAA